MAMRVLQGMSGVLLQRQLQSTAVGASGPSGSGGLPPPDLESDASSSFSDLFSQLKGLRASYDSSLLTDEQKALKDLSADERWRLDSLTAEEGREYMRSKVALVQSNRLAMKSVVLAELRMTETEWNALTPLRQAQYFAEAAAIRVNKSGELSTLERRTAASSFLVGPPEVIWRRPSLAIEWEKYTVEARADLLRDSLSDQVRTSSSSWNWTRVADAYSNNVVLTPAAKEIAELNSALEQAMAVKNISHKQLAIAFLDRGGEGKLGNLYPEERSMALARTLVFLSSAGPKSRSANATLESGAIERLSRACDAAARVYFDDPDTDIRAAISGKDGVGQRPTESRTLKTAIEKAFFDPAWENATAADRGDLIQAAYVELTARSALTLRMPAAYTDPGATPIADNRLSPGDVNGLFRIRPLHIAA